VLLEYVDDRKTFEESQHECFIINFSLIFDI